MTSDGSSCRIAFSASNLEIRFPASLRGVVCSAGVWIICEIGVDGRVSSSISVVVSDVSSAAATSEPGAAVFWVEGLWIDAYTPDFMSCTDLDVDPGDDVD